MQSLRIAGKPSVHSRRDELSSGGGRARPVRAKAHCAVRFGNVYPLSIAAWWKEFLEEVCPKPSSESRIATDAMTCIIYQAGCMRMILPQTRQRRECFLNTLICRREANVASLKKGISGEAGR